MKFSIIIPALNEAKTIRACLESLKKQRYPKKDFEIIVVDGNSRDRTRAISRKYGRVIVEKRRGIAIARNRGAKAARGKIFVFIDSDTILSDNMLSEMDKAFTPNVSGMTVTYVPVPRKFQFWLNIFFVNAIAKMVAAAGFSISPTMCLASTKQAFRRVGGFNEKLYSGEDIDFSSKLWKAGKFKVLGNVFAFTSMRRIENWGQVYFAYRYFSGFFGKEYTRVN